MKNSLTFLHLIIFYMLNFQGFSQNPNWVSGIRAGNSGAEESNDIVIDSMGNVYITGWYNSPTITFGSVTLTNSGSGSDIFIVKFDKNYNIIWAKSAGIPVVSEMARSITVDKSNNIIITGMFGNNITFGTVSLTGFGNGDIFTVKYDQNGNALWANAAGGSTGDQGRSVAVDNSNNVYVTGSFSSLSLHFGSDTTLASSSGNDDDFFIVKYNAEGNLMWARAAGSSNPSGSRNDIGFGIAADNDGHVYAAGQFTSDKIGFDTDTLINNQDSKQDIFIACYNTNNGSIVWAKKAGGLADEYLNNIQVDSIGNFVITGYTNSINCIFNTNVLTKIGNSDGIVAKYDHNGNVIWAKNFGYASSVINVSDAFVDTSGNVYLNGNFGVKFILGNDTLNTNGGNDVFVTKIDNTGNGIWAIGAGGNSLDWTYSIAGDESDIFITGMFLGNNLQFNTNTLTSIGSQDLFVGRLNENTITNINDLQNSEAIILSPNPSSGLFYIKNTSKIKSLEVINVLGQKIRDYKSMNDNTQIDLSNEPNGIYYIGLIDKSTGEKVYEKILIEK